jgi:dipeptide transport system substrate-binding protein
MKRYTVLASALMMGTMLAAGAAHAKSLAYCSEGSPENFTPALNITGTSLDAARPVFNQLVEFERGSTKVVPGLAESWEVSPDGTQVTFHLRKGVKFHSGVNGFTPSREFNAEDVLWSFNRQWKEDHPYHKVSGGAYDYFNDMGMPDLLKSIEKVDDYTVKMTLNEPNAPIMANLAMDFATIESAEYAKYLMDKGTPEQFDQIPVGTGPFQFVDYQKDAVIRYSAFADYWGGKAKIDDLVYAITPDATARYAKLKADECQVMIAPNPADLASMKQDSSINLLSQPGLNVGYLAMNTQKPPFDKKEVRQAIYMAIDRDAIIKEVYQGSGQKAKNLIPPTIWS